MGSALGIRIRDFSPRDLFVGAEGEERYHSTKPQAADTPSSAFKLSSPEKDFLLVWGGGTVSGFFAAQLGKHAGLKVIVVASQVSDEKEGSPGRTADLLLDLIQSVPRSTL